MSNIDGVDDGVGYGVHGKAVINVGVVGESNDDQGVVGTSNNGFGVHDVSIQNTGVSGEVMSGIGVMGVSHNGGVGMSTFSSGKGGSWRTPIPIYCLDVSYVTLN
jgi:hypothetical protein